MIWLRLNQIKGVVGHLFLRPRLRYCHSYAVADTPVTMWVSSLGVKEPEQYRIRIGIHTKSVIWLSASSTKSSNIAASLPVLRNMRAVIWHF